MQLQLSGEELHSISERDSTGGVGSGGSDAASPLTAKSLRLEQVVQALAREELRRYIFHFVGRGISIPKINQLIYFFYIYNINYINTLVIISLRRINEIGILQS